MCVGYDTCFIYDHIGNKRLKPKHLALTMLLQLPVSEDSIQRHCFAPSCLCFYPKPFMIPFSRNPFNGEQLIILLLPFLQPDLPFLFIKAEAGECIDNLKVLVLDLGKKPQLGNILRVLELPDNPCHLVIHPVLDGQRILVSPADDSVHRPLRELKSLVSFHPQSPIPKLLIAHPLFPIKIIDYQSEIYSHQIMGRVNVMG